MNTETEIKVKYERKAGEPTQAFVLASWSALIVSVAVYLIGLYNSKMMLNEQGYYFTLLLFGLFSAVSLQKTVRDRDDNIEVTNLYYGLCWVALLSALTLMFIGLWNAGSIIRSEKGFYAMTYILSLFSSVVVQKNVRDIKQFRN